MSAAQTAAPASDWVDGPQSVFQLQPRRRPVTPPPQQTFQQDQQPDSAVNNSTNSQDTQSNNSANAGMGSSDRQTEMPSNIPTLGVTNGQRPAAPHALEGGVEDSETRRAPATVDQNVWNEQPPAAGVPQSAAVDPKMYSGWLSQTHPDLTTMAKDSVIEVKGQWDDAGHALHNFGFNFTRIAPSALAKTPLTNTNVMIVDCAGEIPSASLEVIRNFVANGGYLITTDWSLDNCLARAIPGFVSWNSANSISECVDAAINRSVTASDDSDLLLNTVSRAYWKLDDKCQMVKINRPDAVTVLVHSKRLAYQDPNRTFALTGREGFTPNTIGILACTFRYEKGRVLHLVGHFDNNTDLAFKNSLPDPAPRIGISLRQAIAANFIAAGLAANPHPLQKAGK
ncbi:MAG TPA: hypothetical protein V6C76_02430 [Drouetiella sp.]